MGAPVHSEPLYAFLLAQYSSHELAFFKEGLFLPYLPTEIESNDSVVN